MTFFRPTDPENHQQIREATARLCELTGLPDDTWFVPFTEAQAQRLRTGEMLVLVPIENTPVGDGEKPMTEVKAVSVAEIGRSIREALS